MSSSCNDSQTSAPGRGEGGELRKGVLQQCHREGDDPFRPKIRFNCTLYGTQYEDDMSTFLSSLILTI